MKRLLQDTVISANRHRTTYLNARDIRHCLRPSHRVALCRGKQKIVSRVDATDAALVVEVVVVVVVVVVGK